MASEMNVLTSQKSDDIFDDNIKKVVSKAENQLSVKQLIHSEYANVVLSDETIVYDSDDDFKEIIRKQIVRSCTPEVLLPENVTDTTATDDHKALQRSRFVRKKRITPKGHKRRYSYGKIELLSATTEINLLNNSSFMRLNVVLNEKYQV